jgi:hypothetical protein
MRFAIDDAIIDIIIDDDNFALPLSQFLPGCDPKVIEAHRGTLEPDFLDLAEHLVKFAIQSFVLRVEGRTLLIDTCIGEGKDCPEIPAWHQRRESGYLERLHRAGVDPAEVDLVFCTHLHVDHVGWNTRRHKGRFEPTFPNARYLFGRRELNDWIAQRNAGRAPLIHARALEESVIPIVEAGRADLVDDGYDLGPGLRLEPLPGIQVARWDLKWSELKIAQSFAEMRCTVRSRSTSQAYRHQCVSIQRSRLQRARRSSQRLRTVAGSWCLLTFAVSDGCISVRMATVTSQCLTSDIDRPQRLGRVWQVACD